MRRLLAVCLLLACARRISGPAPAVSGARAQQDGSASPAMLCNAQRSAQVDGWLVDVLGQNFAPLPTNALSGTPGLLMPEVLLIGPQTYRVPDSRVQFADPTRLVVTMPTADTAADAIQLAAGDYTLSVGNLGGDSSSVAAAVHVIDPPVLDLLQVAPTAGAAGSARICNDADETIVVTGSGFRPGAPPTVSLVNGPAGPVGPLSVMTATPTQLTVAVPNKSFSPAQSSPTGATYTLSVQDPSGCWAPAAAATRSFNVTDVKVYPTCKKLGSPPATPSVTPAWGWAQRNQPITIHVTGGPAQLFTGGAPSVTITSQLKGSTTPVTIPLRSVAFIDTNTVTAVVPTCSGASSTPVSDLSPSGCPNGMMPGAYSIDVDDPKGAFGAVQFTVVAGEPISIASISPAAVDTSGTADLAIASGGVSGVTFPATARPQIVFPLTGPGAAVLRACDLPINSQSASAIHARVQPVAAGSCADYDANGVKLAAAGGGFAPAAGLYVIRVKDSVAPYASADYTGLAITNPAAAPANGTALSASLTTARASFAMVQAADDTGAPYLYAIGGITGPIAKNGSQALTSTEVGALGAFGDVASFQPTESLTSARHGAAAVAVQIPGDTGYVFVLGGVDTNGAPLGTVERAQVLRTADAPVLETPAIQGGGGFFFAGSFYYRISALLPPTDPVNPSGETLASDLEPATVSGGGKVVLSWRCVPNAVGYRVYRTAGPNQAATGFRLIASPNASVACTGSPLPYETFSDTGLFAGAAAPLPPGALGSWVPMPPLSVPRGEAAGRLVGGRIYVVGGCGGTAASINCDSGSLGNELATYETAPLAGLGLGSFSTGPLVAARRRTALALASRAGAIDRFADASSAWLVVAGGEASTALTSGNRFEVAQVLSGGGAVAAPAFSAASYTLPAGSTGLSGGWAEVAGDLLLAYGYTGAVTNFAFDGHDVCNGTACASAGSFTGALASTGATTTVRYLPGETLWTAFIYAGGGLTSSASGQPSTATALATVERIAY